MSEAKFRPIAEAPEGWQGINEATKTLGFKHSQYTRRLILEGKLDDPEPAERFQGKGYTKWMVSPKSLASYLEKVGVRGGSRRFTLKTDLENEEKVRAALDASGVEYTLELSYKGKAKESAEAE
jgi:hypothetical protein